MTLTRINLLGIDNYLDVSEDVVVPINFSIADIRDVQAKSGSYSKSIKVIGTKHNNEVLNYLFDVNAVSLTYNLNVKQPCQIVQNDELILDNAILQLVNVEKVSNGMNDDEQVIYTVTVKDTVGDLFTDIGNAMLTDLDFSDLNHVYTSANVVASWSHDVTDGYKYILPMSSDNIYQLPEMKPAIYLKTYFDRIFSNAGYQYQFDEAVATGFNKLLMPYNGDKVKVDEAYLEEAKIIAENTTSTDYFLFDQLIIDTEIQDPNSAYNPTTSIYTSEYSLNVPNAIQFRFTIDYDILLENTGGTTAFCTIPSSFNPSIEINAPAASSTVQIDSISYDLGDAVPVGVNIIASGIKTISGVTSNVLLGDLIDFRIIQPSTIGLPIFTPGIPTIYTIRINSIRMEIFPSADTIGYLFPIVMNQYVPVQIKQSDFMKSIFTMFNIFCQPDETDPTKIVLKTRDKFYDTGVVKNWSRKFVKDKPHVVAFLPEVTAKTLTLTYAQDKDPLNAGYLQNVSEIYGQVKYVFDNEYIKNDDKKSLIFGASPFIDTSFGAIVMGINGSEPKTLPRIVYDGGNYPCGTFYIYDYGTTGTACTSYPYTTHFDKPLNPDLDFNFGICDYYFSQSYQNTTLNNLSTLYWRRTMSQINGGKLYIVYLDLTPHDIANLKLNDKIYLDRSYWNINKVIDYDANSNEPTKVELLSIDDELVLPKIVRKIDEKPNSSSSLIKPFIQDVLGDINGSLTINASTGNIVLNGKGNVIDSVVSNAVVIGDNQVVTKNGITTNVANVNENFANTDLTFTDNRIHDFDSKYLILRNGVIGFDATGILTSTAYSFVSDNNVGSLDTTVVIENEGGGGALTVNDGNVRLIVTPTYADEAAATTAGLLNGTIYKTATGELRIKL